MANDKKGITREYPIKSLQGFMIFPDQITTYIADNDMPWEYVWIEFGGLRAKAVVEAAGFDFAQPVYKARSKELREEMMKEMNYIVENSSLSPLHLIGHLYLFADYLLRSTKGINVQHSSNLRDFYIHEALEFIDHNFQNYISVEDIADVCGLNRTYFGKIFKEAIGKSPQEFLINYRMIKATELLMLTKLSIGDIGSAVGYDNQLHFSRAFKSVYGISPKKWRTEHIINK